MKLFSCIFNDVRLAILVISLGIVPSNSFDTHHSSCKLLSCFTSDGIVPFNEL